MLTTVSSKMVAVVVRLSETVEELVGEAVILSLKTVDVVLNMDDVVFCAKGGVVVVIVSLETVAVVLS